MTGVQTCALPILLLGTRAGSIGESGTVLIAIGAVYLLITKTAQWRLMLSTVLGGFVVAMALWLSGVPQALPPQSLLAGSFLFIAVFMSTDPVSAPKKQQAQWAYGLLIGAVVIIIRTFSLFPEGTSFALFVGNTFASLFDRLAPAKKKAPSAATRPAAGGTTGGTTSSTTGAAAPSSAGGALPQGTGDRAAPAKEASK